MKFKTNLKASSGLFDLTPLMDVILLMLIFFIITSDVLPFKSLQVENPVLNRDSTALTTQLLVVMDAQHVIYVGSKKAIVDLLTLKAALQAEIDNLKRQSKFSPTVVLSVDRRVEYGVFLQVFAIVQECCPRLRLVYQPSEDEALG